VSSQYGREGGGAGRRSQGAGRSMPPWPPGEVAGRGGAGRGGCSDLKQVLNIRRHLFLLKRRAPPAPRQHRAAAAGPPPLPRTNRTSLVPPLVLSGHEARAAAQAGRAGPRSARGAGARPPPAAPPPVRPRAAPHRAPRGRRSRPRATPRGLIGTLRVSAPKPRPPARAPRTARAAPTRRRCLPAPRRAHGSGARAAQRSGGGRPGLCAPRGCRGRRVT
jgi:hypothetical protein